MKLGLIGHSQAVALLDALGDWRPHANLDPGGDVHRRAGLNDTFKGWTTSDVGNNLFTFPPSDRFAFFSDLRVCLISGGTRSADLCTATTGEQGQIELNPSPFLIRLIEKMADVDAIISTIRGAFYVQFRRFLVVKEHPEFDIFPYDDEELTQPIDQLYIDNHIRTFVTDCCFPLMVIRNYLKTKPIIQ